MLSTQIRTSCAVLLSAALLLGCRGNREDTEMPADTLQAGAHAALSDGEVVHAVLTATEIGAANASQARTAAEHVDVERFAQVLYADQNALQQAFTEVAQAAGVQTQENQVSQELRTVGQRLTERVQNLSGRAFDDAFLQGGIEFYQALLDAIDSRLLASVRSDELRGTLRDARPTFEAHLQRALQLRSQLAYSPEAQQQPVAAGAAQPPAAQPAAGGQPPTVQPPAQGTPPVVEPPPPPRPPLRDTIVMRPPPDTLRIR
jgi:putative membrane protein